MARPSATVKETSLRTRLGESSDNFGPRLGESSDGFRTRLGESSDDAWRIDRRLASSSADCEASTHCGYCSLDTESGMGSHFAKWLSVQASERARLFFQRQAVVASELSMLVASQLDSAEPWIVFPHFCGADLQQWLAHQPQSLPRMRWVAIAEQLLRQLSFVHGAGYVHGRLSAEHVWLTNDEQVRLIGLGACQPIGHEADEAWLRHRVSTVAGRYLPPEQTGKVNRVPLGRGDGELTSASDIYSAAVVIEELSGGRFATSAVWRCMLAENPYDRPTAGELVELFSSYHLELLGRGRQAA